MDTNKNSIVYKDLSYQIIGLAMEVHGKLGFGKRGDVGAEIA
jgi:hypothetical protein